MGAISVFPAFPEKNGPLPQRVSAAREEEYWTCYDYLRRHTPWMAYSRYRRQGLPIGSGEKVLLVAGF